MLDEYAINPDVFYPACYSNPDLCAVFLQQIKEPLLQEAVVSDLRMGVWSRNLNEQVMTTISDLRARELLKKLREQNRLRPVPECLPNPPVTEVDWCEEAIQADQVNPINGVIVSSQLAKTYPNHSRVTSIEKLHTAGWYRRSGQSQTTHRSVDEYLKLLNRLFQCARSLMFIDPYLDPEMRRYGRFLELLLACKRVCPPQPTIEVHRMCTIGAGEDARIPDRQEWQSRFQHHWQSSLHAAGLKVEVFIWKYMHDRFLVTDLMGLQTGNGFDESSDRTRNVTWSRLSKNDREKYQREFDPNFRPSELRCRFEVGAV